MSRRDLLAREALALIPKILTLQDRNPHSPTFGCFDRNYWHYKIIDFPSGMAQEFVWPLALAWEADLEGNPYRGEPAVRQWIDAGLRFAARSSHGDGSSDDYFPWERAAGATAFSMLACLESYRILGMKDGELEDFFRRRANWLARKEEAGRLSNHHALIAVGLLVAGQVLETDEWDAAREARLDQLLGWQSEEGWFPEYHGFDPGYQTLTISLLARLSDADPGNERLREAVSRAAQCTAQFLHPDGSFGGEYGSRNTYNFFPHGFELVGRWRPELLAVNDRFLDGLAAGRAPCYADDHILGHHAWNYLLAWRDWHAERPAPQPPADGRVHLPEAGLLIDRRSGTTLYVALNKGGVFKCFDGARLAVSDTQISLNVRRGGRSRCAVAHLSGDYEVELTGDAIEIRGAFGWAKQTLMTTPRLILLRAVMAVFGRFFPDLIRGILQRMLITSKADAPYRFTRRIEWDGTAWRVRDEIHAPSWKDVEAAGIGGDQTSVYVVMSRTYQSGQMQPWLELTPRVRELADGQPLIVERVLTGESPA